MKILFQYLTGGGGALSNVIMLLKALSKRFPDDHIDVVCAESSDLVLLDSLRNINVIPYGNDRMIEIDRLILGYGGLNEIAKDRQSDIIWSLNLGSYIKTTVPHVLSIHNPHQVYPWRVTRSHPASRPHVAALRFFFRRSLRISDAIIVQTPIMGRYASRFSGAPKRIAVAPKSVENFKDINSCHLSDNIKCKIAPETRTREFRFLYVATFSPHKNHHTLVEAFHLLAARGEMVTLFLTIEEEELIHLGGEMAKSLIDSGHIVPLGWVKKEALRALYELSDCCLMPSILESLSSAHLEAMQWGKPQITSDLPYAVDLCGEAAIYVPAKNPVAWAESIKKIMEDDFLRNSLIEEGYKRMRSFPTTWEEASVLVHEVFEETIGDRQIADH